MPMLSFNRLCQHNFVLLVCTVLLSACSANSVSNQHASRLPQFNHALIHSDFSENVPEIASLTYLSEAQREELAAFIARDNIKALPNRIKVTQFINHKMTNFNYEGKNYTSTESWSNQSGNCMALALLTYSVAKELNVYPVFQVVHAPPILTNITSDILVTSDHVRTFLYDEKPSGHFLSDSVASVIDYFPDRFDRTGAIISEPEFLAMFYRNLAADAMLAKQYEFTFMLLEKGLSLAPSYDALINMMAITHRRLGDEQTAEKLYQHALNIKPNSLAVLSNYRLLLELQSRIAEAEKIDQYLLSLESSNPYSYYSLGIEALEFKDYKTTVIFLEKFIDNAPYFHPAYFALARAQLGLGNTKKAQKILKKAIELTDMPGSKKHYLAKLDMLKKVSD
ncbi:tetratricopeptide repeat protein [Shewanella sp. A14]